MRKHKYKPPAIRQEDVSKRLTGDFADPKPKKKKEPEPEKPSEKEPVGENPATDGQDTPSPENDKS